MESKQNNPISFYNEYYLEKYYLYATDVELRNHWKGKTYYFSKSKKSGALTEIPEGYEVVESPVSKMFFLRKKGGKKKKHVKVIK